MPNNQAPQIDSAQSTRIATQSKTTPDQDRDVVTLSRPQLLDYLSKLILEHKSTDSVARKHTFVAVDGFPLVGKSTLSQALTAKLQQLGQPCIDIELDDFAYPRTIRYLADHISGQEFFNLYARINDFTDCVVAPLKAGQPRQYCPAIRHFGKDIDVERVWLTAPPGAVVIVNGLGLLREEMREMWDFVVYVDISYEHFVSRLISRDKLTKEFWDNKVQPASAYYTDICKPREIADVVLENDDFESIRLVKGPKHI
jgi:uridine kinase